MIKSVFLRLFFVLLAIIVISCSSSNSSNDSGERARIEADALKDPEVTDSGEKTEGNEADALNGPEVSDSGEKTEDNEEPSQESKLTKASELIFNSVFDRGTEISFNLNKEPSLLSCFYPNKLLKMQTLTQDKYTLNKNCDEIKSDNFLKLLGYKKRSVGENNRLILLTNVSSMSQKPHIMIITKDRSRFDGEFSSEILNELDNNYMFSLATPKSFFITDNTISANVEMLQKDTESSSWTVSKKTNRINFMKTSNFLVNEDTTITCSSDSNKKQHSLSGSHAFMSIRQKDSLYYFVLNFLSSDNETPSTEENCQAEFIYQENSIFNDDILNYFNKNNEAARLENDKIIPLTFSILK